MDTKRIQGWRTNGVDQIQVALDVTVTSAVHTTFSASGTFERPFAAAPLVLGVNTNGTCGGAATAKVTATAIEVYVYGGSPYLYTAGTLVVTVTLEGEVA